MAAYRLRIGPPEKYLRSKRKALLWLAGFVAAGIICAFSIEPWHERFPQAFEIPSTLLALSSVGALFSLLILLGKRSALKARGTFLITVTHDGVLRHDDRFKDMFLTRQEIIGLRERANQSGLVLLTSDRMRLIHIPPDLEAYAECRAEILALGIPPQIAPEHIRRLWAQTLTPVVVILVGLLFKRSTTNPLEATAGAVLTLAVLLWLEYKSRRNLKEAKGPWLLLILMNVIFLAKEVMEIWHYQPPAYYRRAINDLLLVLAMAAVLQWLFQTWRNRRNAPAHEPVPQ